MPDSSPQSTLSAIALVCSLKPSPAESSSELMAEHVCEQLREHGVKTDSLRCVDYSIAPGVETDMGDGDEWPKIRERVPAADILLLSTPVWLGHPSSITQRVLERLDAELSTTDDQGRPTRTGTAKRCRARTTTSSTKCRRRWRKPRLRRRVTPLTWPGS
jgi:multimeric flavodoxin WrbA